MEITYYGHSCFLIKTGGKSLLFDPFISGNELAKHIDIKKIAADYMILSHAHFDHVADVELIHQQTGAKIISNWEIVSHFERKGIKGGHPMNIGGSWSFDFGKLKMVSAVHSSSFGDGSYGGNPAGFILQSEGKTIYYSGDTALHGDMRWIGENYKLDLALICMGDNFTMGYEEAAIAAQWTGAKKVLGMHFDTFPYIVIDKEEAKQAFQNKGIGLTLMEIGHTLSI